ncbi:MAG: hypothetical protein B7Y25_01290 [Alphaproteobacteria bacterium 16-39-46]|nr:MAG: hypothetical protein B7Y25_01290 [Alphaproteobacteria bacterium 16-39-46]OZA44124.1 MAG: hypothetical protein B7X84_01190 [Alphaproteobacteria bacterium 17-39-52]HQS83532.1 TrbI/VirB10 family protein [Alphaproteobacteria bacterium]HQS93300.1 TrbI/VirB10 family protein [Alphaproteobacteria bacterium]
MTFQKKVQLFLVSLSCLGIGNCQDEKEKNKIVNNRLTLNSQVSEFLHNVDHIPIEEEGFSKNTEEKSFEENNNEEAEEKETQFFDAVAEQNILKENEKERASFYQREMCLKRKVFLHQRAIPSLWTQEDSLEENSSSTFKDSNYVSRHKGIKEDISTFPVKGERVLTADRYIPVILENAINSQLPGRFIAIVETHVFANEGRNILLPKGTRIICSYRCLVKEGDTRLNAVCSRALRPDGASILLTDAYVADQMARTGLIGKVDNRTWEKYGSSFIVAGISALAAAGADSAETSIVRQAASNLSVNLGNITTGLLNSHIDLAPVVNVAAGSRLQIIPMTDIWLRSPEEIEALASGKEEEELV